MDEAAFLRIGGDLSQSDAFDRADVDRLAPLYEVVNAEADPISASYEELSFELDREVELLWCKQKHRERPSFTPRLLRDVQAFQQRVKARYAGIEAPPFRYLAWASERPEIFNLGGDLPLICQLVKRKDRAGLLRYARACIDICYQNASKLDLPIVTIALCQGETLGGGFEAALSSDVIIAEEKARFGLPEVLFNLFPGMGAYSFLARRIGVANAEAMIFSGKIYTANELKELGVVDVVVPNGEGRAGVYGYLGRHSRHFTAHRALYKVRRRFSPVTYQELTDIVTLWVDAALELDSANLRKMERLARSQVRYCLTEDEGHTTGRAAVPVDLR
jgi:DSF synthase